MIESAVLLMRERGVEATSFSEVLAHSGAPRGSIYHHFPGGKAQLVEEATRFAGDYIAAGIIAAHDRADPGTAFASFVSTWRSILTDTRFESGCPIVAATLEGERLPAARDAAAQAFRRWEGLIADALRCAGLPRPRSRSLATLIVAALEGAIILARAQRSTAPLNRVMDEIEPLLRDALAG